MGWSLQPKAEAGADYVCGKVKAAYQKMIAEGCDGEYTKAVVGYLALGVDMTIAFSNTLARWENSSEAINNFIRDKLCQCFGIILRLIHSADLLAVLRRAANII